METDWNKSQRIVCQELKKWSNAKEVSAFVLQDQQSWKPKEGSCKKQQCSEFFSWLRAWMVKLAIYVMYPYGWGCEKYHHIK